MQHVNAQPEEFAAITLPENPYLGLLVDKAAKLGVCLDKSPVTDLWLYHPRYRTISIWEPDLYQQPLGFICTVFAHELGHVVDFDANPAYQELTKAMHWLEVPLDIEFSAFMTGYQILVDLGIPMTTDDYAFFIEEPMRAMVLTALNKSQVAAS